MKKYNTPIVSIIDIVFENHITSSQDTGSRDYFCNEFCKHWHFCLDRKTGQWCHDKQHNY